MKYSSFDSYQATHCRAVRHVYVHAAESDGFFCPKGAEQPLISWISDELAAGYALVISRTVREKSSKHRPQNRFSSTQGIRRVLLEWLSCDLMLFFHCNTRIFGPHAMSQDASEL